MTSRSKGFSYEPEENFSYAQRLSFQNRKKYAVADERLYMMCQLAALVYIYIYNDLKNHFLLFFLFFTCFFFSFFFSFSDTTVTFIDRSIPYVYIYNNG